MNNLTTDETTSHVVVLGADVCFNEERKKKKRLYRWRGVTLSWNMWNELRTVGCASALCPDEATESETSVIFLFKAWVPARSKHSPSIFFFCGWSFFVFVFFSAVEAKLWTCRHFFCSVPTLLHPPPQTDPPSSVSVCVCVCPLHALCKIHCLFVFGCF